jgi:transposase
MSSEQSAFWESAPKDTGAETSEGKAERKAKPRFQRINRKQSFWRTINVERLVEEGHPVRAIWDFVGKLDLSSYTKHIRAVEGLAGRPSLDPQLLISLWIYAYSQGVGSARAIERLCSHDPAYQWLTGMEVVNAHSLSDFRVQHEGALKGLFTQVLGLLSAEGLITLERVTQDGTKIRAWAASDSFKGEDRIDRAVEAARQQMEAVDQMPEEESSRRAERARQRAYRQRKERLEAARKQFDAMESEGNVKKKARVSTTDPEARIMKQSDGGFAPSYNVQVNTDAANGLIVSVGVSQAGNDFDQLTPGIESVEQNLGKTPKQVVADGGYVNKNNVVEMESRGVEFIGPQSDEAGKGESSYRVRGVSAEYRASEFIYDTAKNIFLCPQGKILRFEGKHERNLQVCYKYRAAIEDCQVCPAKRQCCPANKVSGRSIQRTEELPEVTKFRQKMQTEEARRIYRCRSQIAETPNLWIKAKFGLRQFCVRGLIKVGMEALWACLTYNIKQWIRLCWRKQGATAATI